MADVSKIKITFAGGSATYDFKDPNAVRFTAQTLTDAQKTQARTNIGAGTSNFNGNYNALSNAPPIEKSSGAYAAAGGYYSTASGQYGFAFGNRVVTTHNGEVAFGKHNESSEDTAFAIGDGRDTQYRHNLMELKTDGTLLLNGNAVKTEGGDDDKLRLGQIWNSTSSSSPLPSYGFYKLFGNIFNITSLTILSSEPVDITYGASVKIFGFGDFCCYQDGTSTRAILRPLGGRTAGKLTTGAWILVENCFRMFCNCNDSSFTTLDLSTFDTSEVKDMTQMFYECTYLTTLDISSFDMTNVIAYDKMFGEKSHWAGITNLKCPKINPHNDIPLNRTLYSQDGTAYTRLPVTTGTSIELRQSWT